MNAVRSIVAGMLCLAGAAQGADELPVKFLEYVESTGEQYVDTGYKPNNNTRITADFQLVQLGLARNYVFGGYYTGGSITYGRCQFAPAAQMFVGCGGGNDHKTISWEEDLNWHTVGLTNKTFWVDGASVYTGTGIGNNSTETLYLFALDANGKATTFATNRIGLVRIYDNSTIQRLMVPCETSLGNVGFWDFVTGKFYGNAVKDVPSFIGGPEVASPLERLEYVKFTKAYLDTGIAPTNHETAICFRDEKSAAGGYLFGSTINDNYNYTFWSSGSEWAWGYAANRNTRSGGVYSANVDHTVVYNDVQGGSVFMDGRRIGKANDAAPTGRLWLGRMYQTYTFEGRIYWVKVTARDTEEVVRWLVPMRIFDQIGLYNPAAGKLLMQSGGTLTAGPLQAGQFEIAGQRGIEVEGMSPACGLYENLTNGEEMVVSAPAETLVAPEFKVTVTGWKLYEWSDEEMDWVYNGDRANASGTGTSFTYVHTGVATKLVWLSSLSNPAAAGGERYVAEFGDDDADGSSWETAKLSVGAAVGALGPEGGKVCVNAVRIGCRRGWCSTAPSRWSVSVTPTESVRHSTARPPIARLSSLMPTREWRTSNSIAAMRIAVEMRTTAVAD